MYLNRDYERQARVGNKYGHQMERVGGTNVLQCARCGAATLARKRDWIGDRLATPCPSYCPTPDYGYHSRKEEDAWIANHRHITVRTGDRCACVACGHGFRRTGLLVLGTPLYAFRCTRGRV